MRVQKSRPPTKVSIHFNKEIVKKLEKKKDLENHKKLIRLRKEIDEMNDWPTDRKYLNYILDLEYGFKKSGLGDHFLDFLKKRFKKTKESVAVLELGYGQGHFLAELKKQLNYEKIPSKVEGISLFDNATEENKKLIDKRTNLPATEHIINKKYDLIVDLNGAIYFSFSELVDYRKEMILKSAYSLKIGGALLLNVDYLKGNPQLKFITAHLKKQGFKTGFYERDDYSLNQHKYNTLVIERIK